MVEATLGQDSPLMGRPIDEAAFAQEYDAVILAVHRCGSRFEAGAEDAAALPGDCLLLMAASPFFHRFETGNTFARLRRVTEYR